MPAPLAEHVPSCLPASRWGGEADDNREMPNATALYYDLHSVPMFESGQGPGGQNPDLGS